VRELEQLLHAHGDQTETVAWVEGILDVYAQARRPRPPEEEGGSYQAIRAREQRARECEALVLALCPAELDATLAHTTLAARLRTHLAELFTFVRDP
jgi:hypothetical protein